jgi:hypothetical protein
VWTDVELLALIGRRDANAPAHDNRQRETRAPPICDLTLGEALVGQLLRHPALALGMGGIH